MAKSISSQVLFRVRKLACLPYEARQCSFAVSVTRLTVLKSLCSQAKVANRFVTYLARKVLERLEDDKENPPRSREKTNSFHRELMSKALGVMEAWQKHPSENVRQSLHDLFHRMRAEQNEYQKISWGAVRNITDWNLFLLEQALHCLLDPQEAGSWAYRMARDYTERYDSTYGTGLIPASVPFLQDVVDFWSQEFGISDQELSVPGKKKKKKEKSPSTKKTAMKNTGSGSIVRYTHRQGQFLAFIHLYRRIHRRGPSEMNLVLYFRVTPPAVHGIVVKVEELGLITREPGVPRSIRVVIPESEIPLLDEVDGPAW